MNYDSIKNIFLSLECAGKAGSDMAQELCNCDNLVTKNREASAASRLIFGTSYIDIAELNGVQKEWLQDYSNYLFPDVPYRVRNFIGEVIQDSFEGPVRLKRINTLEEELRDARKQYTDSRATIYDLREKLSSQESELESLREIVDDNMVSIDVLIADKSVLESDIDGYKKDMDGATATIDQYKAYAAYVSGCPGKPPYSFEQYCEKI